MATDFFKLKYWGRQSDYILPTPWLGREYLVLGKLLISLAKWRSKGLIDFDVYIKPTGVGTLTSTITSEHFKGLEDKYDLTLYVKKDGQYYPLLWLDVTGSSWSEEQSAQRYGEAVYAVLSTKVNIAKESNVAERVFFLHYNDAEDRLKCISASSILYLEKQGKIRKDRFERDAVTDYYLVPVKYWKSLLALRKALRGFYHMYIMLG